MQNLQSKTPYKFKKSYGGTPEPQTPQDAPWLRGPSLKIYETSRSKLENHGVRFSLHPADKFVGKYSGQRQTARTTGEKKTVADAYCTIV